MKITELITKLEEIKESDGDLDVCIIINRQDEEMQIECVNEIGVAEEEAKRIDNLCYIGHFEDDEE